MKKSNRPLISVIIPIYKVEEYLSECIESVINQSYTNLEIILVDDGSPDNCPSICDDYKKKDKRIKVVHKKNGGLSDARNAGLDIATGEYICFIDSDDYVACDYAEKLFTALCENDADMSVCGYENVFPDGKKEIREKPKTELLNEEKYWSKVLDGMYVTFVVAWNKLYKREIFSQIRYEKGKINEDEIILHHILSKCDRIAIISDPLYYYRKRENSIMGSKKQKRVSDDAFGGLLDRAEYFLKTEKYNYCALQIYFLLGEIASGSRAKKYSKRMIKIADAIPDEYKSRDLKKKIKILHFMPYLYGLKRFR